MLTVIYQIMDARGKLESTREWYVRAARGLAETELQLLKYSPNFLSTSTTIAAQLKA